MLAGAKNLDRKNSIQSQQTFGGSKRKQSENIQKDEGDTHEETNLAKRNKRGEEEPPQ
jgi:hypothetical protein